jgi:putative redox protein
MDPHVRDAPQAREQLSVRTTGGRDVRVGPTAPGDTEGSGRHVSLHIGHSPGGQDGARAALTPAQARQLAGALLQQAAAEDGTADATANRVEVSYLGGESYAVATRGHALLTDQPATASGADTAMTPTELLIAALSSCVAFYAGRYLARHGLNRDGLHVTATFTTATDRPARVGALRLTIQVPGGIPPRRQAALLAVASHCTVHNTLRQPPEVAIKLTSPHGP